jgi:glyoxylate reductase
MKKVFITRKIPDVGVSMLKDKGYEVDISPHDRPLTKEELINFLKIKSYDAVLSLLTDEIDADIFNITPAVKIFANYAVGFDNFDIKEGKRRGVCLTNTPRGGISRVAEHTWGLILALTCRIVEGDSFMRQGKYTGWDPMLFSGIKITGKTLGLIGAGHIGSQVARIAAKGFNMRVAYFDIARNKEIESIHGASYQPTIEEVLKQADIVSLHTPLTPETRHLMNADRLRIMKPTAYLINTSRGAVVDEAALVQALKSGTIKGAGLDVYENEPYLASGLAELPNVVLTPHIASATMEDRSDMAVTAARNIIDVLDGSKPRNMVY